MVAPEQLKFLMRTFRKKKPMRVHIDRIEPHPNYPEDRLKDLHQIEESIKAQGFRDDHPLKVKPHPVKRGYYQLVDGHRRLKAAKNCLHDPKCKKLTHVEVPIVVDDYSKKELDDLYDEDKWKRYPIPHKKVQYKNPHYCPQCGTKLMPGDSFCPECGFKLK